MKDTKYIISTLDAIGDVTDSIEITGVAPERKSVLLETILNFAKTSKQRVRISSVTYDRTTISTDNTDLEITVTDLSFSSEKILFE